MMKTHSVPSRAPLRAGLRLSAAWMSAVLIAMAAAAAFARPNVLLIMTDDQGWGDLRSHGNELIDTPALDRLAGQSVRFDRFYVSSVCAPTRASLLTGRYHLRTGVSGVTHRLEVMRAEEVTLAEVFKANGYVTGCFGKWHNGEQYPNNPQGQGFDEFFGFCGGHWNLYFDAELEHNGQWVKTEGYITDVLTDAALEWIETNRDKPFFCYIPYNAPHTPWQLPDRYFDKYKARGLNDATASAYGMVENIDDNVGRLLRKLDELNLADNTIVIFLTDNGPNGSRYNGGMRGRKASVHEGGVRVPFFLRWPAKLEPRAVEPIAAHIDLLPTLVELCGLPKPATLPLDGISLVPLLHGRADNWPDRMIFSHQAGRGELTPAPGSLRTQQYRLVSERPGVYQLYDMRADPGQKRDLAGDKPKVTERLSLAYEQWFAQASAGARDERPIDVGHRASPAVRLPAPEAGRSGGVEFHNKPGYAHDWLGGWKSPRDRIWWDLNVVRPGRYEVVLHYSCAPSDAGARVRVQAGERALRATIDRPFDGGVLLRPDRTDTKRWMREFAPLTLGVLQLDKGRTRLTLAAEEIPGETVAEVGAVQLRAVE